MKQYHVQLGFLDLTTNAKRATPQFITALLDFYEYSDDKDCFAISYSDDYFHEAPTRARDRLRALRFVHPRGQQNLNPSTLLAEGRWKDNTDLKVTPQLFVIDMDADQVLGEIYLNCKGNIVSSCDMSYKHQDDPEAIVCHVNYLNIIQSLNDYNKRLTKG
jgi:hypothetical protein